MIDCSTYEGFITLTTATVRLHDGGTQVVKCWAGDKEKLDGCLIKPFFDDTNRWRVFVREDQNEEPTDYEKDNGHLTDGVGLFHYLNKMGTARWCKCHFINNDWTDMTRGNWDTARGKSKDPQPKDAIAS